MCSREVSFTSHFRAHLSSLCTDPTPAKPPKVMCARRAEPSRSSRWLVPGVPFSNAAESSLIARPRSAPSFSRPRSSGFSGAPRPPAPGPAPAVLVLPLLPPPAPSRALSLELLPLPSLRPSQVCINVAPRRRCCNASSAVATSATVSPSLTSTHAPTPSD